MSSVVYSSFEIMTFDVDDMPRIYFKCIINIYPNAIQFMYFVNMKCTENALRMLRSETM